MIRSLCLDITAVLEPSGYESNNVDTYLNATITKITRVLRESLLLVFGYICVGDASEDEDVLQSQR